MKNKNFQPTFLYIKQHTKTGLMYFGKTTRNPERYKGSGKYWLRHINQHGKEHVINLWYCLFTYENSLTEFATLFSEENDITNSALWANLQPENGLDGHAHGVSPWNKGLIGFNAGKPSPTKGMKLGPQSQTHKDNISKALTGKTVGFKRSRNKTTINFKTVICPHCGLSGKSNAMTRWHFANCQSK